MANKTFTITCTMEERWVTPFITMLGHMAYFASIGKSAYIGMFCDGDGDFQPKFIDDSMYPLEPKKSVTIRKGYFYDAG